MRVELMLYGIRATATETGWECGDKLMLKALETTIRIRDIVGYTPSRAEALADMAVDSMNAKIISISDVKNSAKESLIY